ncbi:MAG: SocA family protein [Pyrinomonadaceae bacterium]|nr:SocA family protein [Phycisphaerales bacterium]
MKLQKLIYYAHGWCLALTNKPLINEQVEAWQWGPVIPSVYHEFKACGNAPIKGSRYTDVTVVPRGSDGKPKFLFSKPTLDESTAEGKTAKSIVDKVWSEYNKFSAIQLSAMTHRPGSPWDITWNKNGGSARRGTDIPQETIRAHFSRATTGTPND